MSPSREYVDRFLAAARENLPSWAYQQLHAQAMPKAGGDASWQAPMISPLESAALPLIGSNVKSISDDDIKAIRAAMSRWSKQAGRRGSEIKGLEAAATAVESEAKRRGLLSKSEVLNAMTEAEQKEYDAETAKIRESAKTPEAKAPHDFKPAKWTHKNGHPRCVVCGDEEPIEGRCDGREEHKSEDPPAGERVMILCAAPAKRVVYYLVARDGMKDSHGHRIERGEIEEGAYGYVTKSRQLKFEHGPNIDGRAELVEFFLASDDMATFWGEEVKPGDWIVGIRYDKPLYELVLKGDYGISWGGYAEKVEK
jgi:hypothetical protein